MSEFKARLQATHPLPVGVSLTRHSSSSSTVLSIPPPQQTKLSSTTTSDGSSREASSSPRASTPPRSRTSCPFSSPSPPSRTVPAQCSQPSCPDSSTLSPRLLSSVMQKSSQNSPSNKLFDQHTKITANHIKESEALLQNCEMKQFR